jgi:hypothetical protein
MIDDRIGITNIIKHKMYRASLMDKSEVKKWMEHHVYNPESELVW